MKEGRLSYVPPQMRGDVARRHVFLEAGLALSLEAAIAGRSKLDVRRSQILQDVDTFTTGKMISFGNHPFEKGRSAFMARTDPIELGIFDIRSNDPSPALRLFGAFSETDVFIGLTLRIRKELGGKHEPHFSDAITSAQLTWNTLFPRHKPFVSVNPTEHVSQNVHLV